MYDIILTFCLHLLFLYEVWWWSIYRIETCSCTKVWHIINVVFRLTVNLIVCAVCNDKELVNYVCPYLKNGAQPCDQCYSLARPVYSTATKISICLLVVNVPRRHFKPQGMHLYFTISYTHTHTHTHIYIYIYIYIYITVHRAEVL